MEVCQNSMSRRYVDELHRGEVIEQVFLVGQKQLRSSRTGSLYIQFDLRDKTGGIDARLWNASQAMFDVFDVGDFLQVRGRAENYQGMIQLIVDSFVPVDAEQIDLTEFLPTAPRPVDDMMADLRRELDRVEHPDLKQLADAFLQDRELMDKFQRAPAGIKNHHAYLGGLLEHVLAVMKLARGILEVHGDVIDRDLFLTGVLVHDIGKVDELGYERSFIYTDPGQLLGHIQIGVSLLERKLAEWEAQSGRPFPHELAWRLKHMILSHHGSYEFGSPKLPMTTEAIALSHVDNLDAKVHSFARDIRTDPNRTSRWTAWNPSLGRKLYKGHAQSDSGEDVPDSPA